MILDTRLGNTPRWFLVPPEDYNMRVPDVVRECVVFIGTSEVDDCGQLTTKWRGTGFFVSVPSESNPNIAYIYLVTAQHVARHVEASGLIIRVNTKDGKAESLPVPPNLVNWWYHPTDAHADVAAVPIGLSQERFQYITVPTSMFLTEEILQEGTLGVGDEVYITGLFRNMTGTTRNLPIVRIGNVAMMPSERVPTKYYDLMNAYLIEARSLGGLSGSPVFIHTHVRPQMFLFGVMHGHWELSDTQGANPDTEMHEDFGDEGQKVNMGIAIVVPAVDILATLNQSELVEGRRKQDETLQRQNLPVMDSE